MSSHSDYDSSADESGAEEDLASTSSSGGGGVSDSGYQRQRIVPRDRLNRDIITSLNDLAFFCIF